MPALLSLQSVVVLKPSPSESMTPSVPSQFSSIPLAGISGWPGFTEAAESLQSRPAEVSDSRASLQSASVDAIVAETR
jgi:hypothetical protein